MGGSEIRLTNVSSRYILDYSFLYCVCNLTCCILLDDYLDLSLIHILMFLIVGSRVFDPLTLALINLAEVRYYSIACERILNLLNEPEMSGTQDAPEQGDIIFRSVSFGYNDKYILHDISVIRSKRLSCCEGWARNGAAGRHCPQSSIRNW